MREIGIALLIACGALALAGGYLAIRGLCASVARLRFDVVGLQARVHRQGCQIVEQRSIECLRSRRAALWNEHVETGSELAFKRLEAVDQELQLAQLHFGENTP